MLERANIPDSNQCVGGRVVCKALFFFSRCVGISFAIDISTETTFGLAFPLEILLKFRFLELNWNWRMWLNKHTHTIIAYNTKLAFANYFVTDKSTSWLTSWDAIKKPIRRTHAHILNLFSWISHFNEVLWWYQCYHMWKWTDERERRMKKRTHRPQSKGVRLQRTLQLSYYKPNERWKSLTIFGKASHNPGWGEWCGVSVMSLLNVKHSHQLCHIV